MRGLLRSASVVSRIKPFRLSTVAPVIPLVLRSYSNAHEAESFEAFNARYVKFFETCDEQFELMRGLNNCFSYDLVPSQEVVEAALRAARRCDDFAMAVRIFEGLKDKVESLRQYDAYLRETAPLRKELGILTHEELYNIPAKKPKGMLSSY